MSTEDANLQIIMGLIVNAGDAKSNAMEAIHAIKEKDVTTADLKMKEADKALIKAHNAQTSMLTSEASGENIDITLLMVHAQDHIMNAITFKELAEEVVDIHKKYG